MSDTTYHLLNVVGIYKSSLKATFYRWYGDRIRQEPELQEIESLLNRRGQFYTLPEIRKMMSVYASAHHECVCDNPEDYSAVEVYAAKKHLDLEAYYGELISQLEEAQS